ncbi:uncharacterized protein B0H18DRAFT_1117054 [Fomitopsis serialis]|uniref:uncharacterized protein n=1 Tax=Fomitopsis serialis TaxID=139415 RepID=UPI0020073D13|nr:uncharacterized protein B0H18DRAFT_1117054 [Neoantrodia serialis]KAH9929980.1 hypothetical protein B0H18DRAFT_1117054 [Neoantrodia serialis]
MVPQDWTQPSLGMHPGGQPQQLQLENEYEVDPAQFQMFHAGRDPQSSRHAGYTSYGPSFGSGQMSYASQEPLMQDAFSVYVFSAGQGFNAASSSSLQVSSVPSVFHGHSSAQVDHYSFGVQPTSMASSSQRPNSRASSTYGGFQQPIDGPQHIYAPSAPLSGPQGGADFHTNAALAYSRMSYDMQGGRGVAKRMRTMGDGLDVDDDDADGLWDDGTSLEQEQKPKPLGACARCKGLKVRCVFSRDSDVCERCTKGNHDCIIPGRKKRRPPPKREHLINQIKEQAAQISDLMNKLEEANRIASRRISVSKSAGQRPMPNICDEGAAAVLAAEDLHGSVPVPCPPAEGDVADWVTNARRSIVELGKYVSMGGASVTVDMLGEEGSVDDASDDEYEYEYEATVEDEDARSSHGEGRVGSVGAESYEPGPSGSALSPASTASTTDGAPGRKAGGGGAKLAILPNEDATFGFMANLALSMSRGVSRREAAPGAEQEEEVGLANNNYFRPSPAPHTPLVDEQLQPAILRNGIIRPDEAEKLFSTYFDYMNVSVSLLDPVIYTAQKTYWRSPFLFTVICAIASRHYCPRPELYQEAMKYARLAAGTALIGGQKSIEAVQAYLLLSLYPVPARRWEDDRSYLYLGLAIRMATDLKLRYPVTTTKGENELRAREMLNRTRTWLNCYNLDRSTGVQYGEAPVIDNNDYVAKHTEDWWQSSPYNMQGFDVHLCCYKAELAVLGEFRACIWSDPERPSGINKNIDVAQIASETDDRLAALEESWKPILCNAKTDDPQCHFRIGLLKLAYSYARLSVLSVGFQHSFGKASPSNEVPFLWRCLRAAKDTVLSVVDGLGTPSQMIYIRHGPEAQSVFVTFASAFLIKLLQPKYSVYLSREQRVEIKDLVHRVIDLLGSPEVAIDDRHGPKLYARFLQGLLNTPMARIDHSPSSLKRDSRRSKTTSIASSPSHASTSARQSLSPAPDSTSTQSSPKPHTPPPTLSPTIFSSTITATSASQMSHPMSSQLAASSFSAPMSPPLFFDSELIQSMQSVDVFPDVVLPG